MANRNPGVNGGATPLRLVDEEAPLPLDGEVVLRLERVAPPTPDPIRLAPAPLDGPGLRRLREARGLSVADLTARTKLTRHHIDAIEGMRREALPAPAYLRGFVRTLARALGADPDAALRDYLDALDAAAR